MCSEPRRPGLSFHKLDKARDKNFWSVRVSDDIRMIVHKTSGSLLLCYVNHHDKAYAWAERRKLEICCRLNPTFPDNPRVSFGQITRSVNDLRSS